jgi:hypothetical protein
VFCYVIFLLIFDQFSGFCALFSHNNDNIIFTICWFFVLTVRRWWCSILFMFCRVVLLVVCVDVWMRQFPVRHTNFLVGTEIRLLFLYIFFCNLENVVLS